MTYYATSKNETRYRFEVEGRTSWMCGNFYHNVKVSVKNKGATRYAYAFSRDVHACDDALEAASFVASKLNLSII